MHQPNRRLSSVNRGRPRDPDLEARVFDSGIALYAEGGWQMFTLDAIARVAGVGKAALYRRWNDRSELLRQTLEARWTNFGAIDAGTLSADLTTLSETLFDHFAGPYGRVILHIRADSWKYPEVHQATQPYTKSLAGQARAIVQRAIDRGELAADTSAALIIDVTVGAMVNRFSTTPEHLRPVMIARRDRIIRDIVNLVIRGTASP